MVLGLSAAVFGYLGGSQWSTRRHVRRDVLLLRRLAGRVRRAGDYQETVPKVYIALAWPWRAEPFAYGVFEPLLKGRQPLQ